MSANSKKLEREAVQLPIRERARLVRRLISTLESEDDGDVEQAWLDEVEKRLASVRSGKAVSHAGEEVFDELLGRS